VVIGILLDQGTIHNKWGCASDRRGVLIEIGIAIGIEIVPLIADDGPILPNLVRRRRLSVAAIGSETLATSPIERRQMPSFPWSRVVSCRSR